MRPLIIDDEARAAVAKVLAHALEEENYYEPGLSAQPPGLDARHVVLLNTYRCVFSITKDPQGNLYRHLSISVPAEGKYPHEFAAMSIAEIFGFTGRHGDSSNFPDGWHLAVDRDDECVIIAQRLDAEATR
jgi:hypothetical protein